MSNTKKITKQNAKAINHFYWFYREDTAKEMSKFLFAVMASYLTTSGIDFPDKEKDEIKLNFTMIHNLVTQLQNPNE